MPAQRFDHTYDVVVAGSGAAAFATALGAQDAGLSVLLLESTDKWGGNSSMSGGGMWLPNSPLMVRDGAGDSREEALTYLEATVGEPAKASNRARKEAFVDGVADFVAAAEKHGMSFVRAADYPDYYPEKPGGKIGRAIEHVPFDVKKIGDWWKSCQAPAALPILTDDVWLLGRAWSTPDGFLRGAKFVARALGKVATGQKPAGIGAGLMSSFLDVVVQQQGGHLWLNSPVTDLVVEDGKVIGVQAERDGKPVTIEARRGVMFAGGGFDYNTTWRQEHHGVDGAPSGAPGNLGQPIAIAERAGAELELMDDAWWGASIAAVSDGGPFFLVGERSYPYSIIVDARGERMANESESYVDLGHHMLEHDKEGPYWLIAETRHARRYLRNYKLDPRANKKQVAEGIAFKADTLAELATQIGVEPSRLAATVERFNGLARTGVDSDFGRGNSASVMGRTYPGPGSTLGPAVVFGHRAGRAMAHNRVAQ